MNLNLQKIVSKSL